MLTVELVTSQVLYHLGKGGGEDCVLPSNHSCLRLSCKCSKGVGVLKGARQAPCLNTELREHEALRSVKDAGKDLDLLRLARLMHKRRFAPPSFVQTGATETQGGNWADRYFGASPAGILLEQDALIQRRYRAGTPPITKQASRHLTSPNDRPLDGVRHLRDPRLSLSKTRSLRLVDFNRPVRFQVHIDVYVKCYCKDISSSFGEDAKIEKQ